MACNISRGFAWLALTAALTVLLPVTVRVREDAQEPGRLLLRSPNTDYLYEGDGRRSGQTLISFVSAKARSEQRLNLALSGTATLPMPLPRGQSQPDPDARAAPGLRLTVSWLLDADGMK